MEYKGEKLKFLYKLLRCNYLTKSNATSKTNILNYIGVSVYNPFGREVINDLVLNEIMVADKKEKLGYCLYYIKENALIKLIKQQQEYKDILYYLEPIHYEIIK